LFLNYREAPELCRALFWVFFFGLTLCSILRELKPWDRLTPVPFFHKSANFPCLPLFFSSRQSFCQVPGGSSRPRTIRYLFWSFSNNCFLGPVVEFQENCFLAFSVRSSFSLILPGPPPFFFFLLSFLSQLSMGARDELCLLPAHSRRGTVTLW